MLLLLPFLWKHRLLQLAPTYQISYPAPTIFSNVCITSPPHLVQKVVCRLIKLDNNYKPSTPGTGSGVQTYKTCQHRQKNEDMNIFPLIIVLFIWNYLHRWKEEWFIYCWKPNWQRNTFVHIVVAILGAQTYNTSLYFNFDL